MSSLDRFTRIGIGDVGAAEQAADSQAAAQASLNAAFEKKQAEANELKDNILDNVETELFRKPVEDLTHKGFQKIGDVSRKVLRQGAKIARAKIAGQPADTRVPEWSSSYKNPAFNPEENAQAATEQANPSVARTPRSVEELTPELEEKLTINKSNKNKSHFNVLQTFILNKNIIYKKVKRKKNEK